MTTIDRHDDRDELLLRLDLAELLEDLARPRGLAARGKQFPCPDVAHEQTGKTPPVSLTTATAGYGLWHCHACDRGGTAVDALIAAGRARDVADAFAQLRDDHGVRASTPTRPRPTRVNGAAAATPAKAALSAEQIQAARLELARYVDACHERLWTPDGAPALQWLRARGLGDAELRANRIGFDPGYRVWQRPRHQLPAPAGPAVTLPLLDEHSGVVYAQARPLDDTEGRSKYLNPHSEWIGPSPRVGPTLGAGGHVDDGVLVACEGKFDAILTARHFAVWEVIGSGQPDASVADRLAAAARGRPIVVCFDADEAGQEGAQRLVALLEDRTSGGVAAIAPPAADINQLLLDAPDEFDATLCAVVATAVRRARPDRPPTLRGAMPALDRSFLDPKAGDCQPTGYAALDAALAGGLRAGVYMLGAPPAVGKTAIATQAAWHIARSGHPVIYLAAEQTVEQLVARHVCSQAELNVSHYWTRSADFRAAWKIARDHQPLDTLAIATDEARTADDQRGSVARLDAMLAEARTAGGPVPVVFVDYLQELEPGSDQRRRDEREQLSTMARALLRLARRHEVPLVIISSVARDKYDSERPTLAAFKGSGDIEYTLDAGLVVRIAADSPEDYERLRRGEEDEIPLELHIVKNRFGRAGGSDPLELRLHADTGALLAGEGGRHDNHPPTLPGFTSTRADNAMPF
jgi:replicative DNA helicase